MEVLSKDTIEQWIVPHLSVGRKRHEGASRIMENYSSYII